MTSEALDRCQSGSENASGGEALPRADDTGRLREILIVDDDPIFRHTLQRMLAQGAGGAYCFATAEHAQQAIELIERHPPDLVISDIFMPVADGFELLNWMRFNAPRIPVLVVSVVDELDENFDPLKIAKDLGAVGALTKPFDRAALVTAIDRAFAGVAAHAH